MKSFNYAMMSHDIKQSQDKEQNIQHLTKPVEPKVEPDIVSHGIKTDEQLVQEEIKADADAQQDTVNSVLYQLNKPHGAAPSHKINVVSNDPISDASDIKDPVKAVHEKTTGNIISDMPSSRYEDSSVTEFKNAVSNSNSNGIVDITPDLLAQRLQEQPISDEAALPDANNISEIVSNKSDILPDDTSSDLIDDGPVVPIKVPRQMSNSNEIHMSKIYGIPTCLITTIQPMFKDPNSTKQVTAGVAVAAYLYCQLGMPADLDIGQNVAHAVELYKNRKVAITNDDLQRKLNDNLMELKKTNANLAFDFKTLELLASYLLYDKMGFSASSPASPNEINFIQTGIADLITQLEKQSASHIAHEQTRMGRPYE